MTHILDTLPLTRLPAPGSYGRTGAPGVTVALREDVAAATLVARRGAGVRLADVVQARFGLTLPDGPRMAGDDALAVLGTGPGRWLALAQTRTGLAAELASTLDGLAAVTDQSDANILFEINGPRVLDLLAKGATVDLDPEVFRPGDVAVTAIAHAGVTLWRPGEEIAYRALVARSFAPAFARFLIAGGAEYGIGWSRRG